MIVVPCNTATTNAISHLRNSYPVPVVGIEPAIKPAALGTKSKRVGILATKGTFSSELFQATHKLHASKINTIEVVGSGIVELVEAGKENSAEMRELLVHILEPFMISGIDYLVLGCSHYPYIKPLLEELLPRTVRIIDSGQAVARQVKTLLDKHQIANPSTIMASHLLLSNARIETLDRLTSGIQNREVKFLDF